MKKISYTDATEIIKAGIPVKALIARIYEPVKCLNDLERLNRLDKIGVQKYELFYEPADVKIPENSDNLNLDEAIILLNIGQKIYSKLNGEELSFSSIENLIAYHKKCELLGDPGLLYWYIC